MKNGWRNLQRSAILVLDDEEGVRDTVARCLEGEGYDVVRAASLGEARDALARRDVMLTLADVTLAHGERGLDLLDELGRREPPVDVIVMTANADAGTAIEALKQGAYDYLCKPFAFELLRAAVQRAVEHQRSRHKTRMLEQLETRRQADDENLQQFLVAMATAIDAKSRFTARHSLRVSELARIGGEAMGHDSTRCDLLALGGRLHDIGKIGIPDAILDKPGPLTTDEFTIMKSHPAVGDDLIAPIKSMAPLRPMIRWHHETMDGRGYPDGLISKDIPEDAWVVKVADYWEAITAKRPYRDPMSVEKAVACLRGEAGTKIPRDVVETFLGAIQGVPIALPG